MMVFDILLLVIAAMLFCLSVALWCQTCYRIVMYRSATGRVTGYRREGDCYLPEFEFVTESGETVSCVSDTGCGVRPYELGCEIRVLYNPRDPCKAAIRSFGYLWLVPLLVGAIAAVFTLGAIKVWGTYIQL